MTQAQKKDNDQVFAHFIGVGGAGMSALALVLLQRGVRITGSDLKESRYTRELERAGMTLTIGHDADNLGDPQVVVVSTAIPEKNPELKEARRRGLPVWQRAQMLAELTKDAETIAIAGTHGKTSTSSMMADVLHELDADPGFCIGGEVAAFQANARQGAGRLFVVEADESDGSFVWLSPRIAVITNLEIEHVDHYDSFDQIEEVFVAFMDRVAHDGALVVYGGDSHLVELARATGRRVVTYGSGTDCEVCYCDVVPLEGQPGSSFTIRYQGIDYPASITLPGEHMASNATAVFAVAMLLGYDPERVAQTLGSFAGVRRRFEYVDEVEGITIVDDYGHHPTEIAATLAGAKLLDYQRVVVLFQPHRYTRTQAFVKEFGEAFDDADLVIFTDIYSSGEAPIPGISGRTLVYSALDHDSDMTIAWLPRRQSLMEYLRKTLRSGDLFMTMGAGDVTTIGPEFARYLREHQTLPEVG